MQSANKDYEADLVMPESQQKIVVLPQEIRAGKWIYQAHLYKTL